MGEGVPPPLLNWPDVRLHVRLLLANAVKRGSWVSHTFLQKSCFLKDFWHFRRKLCCRHQYGTIKCNRTGASPGTFFTVSGTARMVPAEAPKEHFGTKRRVVVWLYIQRVPISCKVIWEVKTLMLFTCHLKNGRWLYESDISSFRVKQAFRVLWTSKRGHTKLAFTAYYHLAKPTIKKNP